MLLGRALGDRTRERDECHGQGTVTGDITGEGSARKNGNESDEEVPVGMAWGARERRQLLFHVAFFQHFLQELYCTHDNLDPFLKHFKGLISLLSELFSFSIFNISLNGTVIH